ncbi:hypothetical protein [Streptomyces sp. NBC_00645]|uniref:hypothetical protein n=1 Tax=Streptomyces sp. NBC_00645 TaxID=2975795 RepID=UPI0032498ADC
MSKPSTGSTPCPTCSTPMAVPTRLLSRSGRRATIALDLSPVTTHLATHLAPALTPSLPPTAR